ncbi:2-oxoglutarate and iron-dependent oxygenase domain-containing protein [Phenylobacterium sp. SCN 70-31]|uniref:isopenicillin N synthase family dioxygenase n=1 Tax=Phenylobacterium sp. SCN 70-31 TaxID=1660129 RepID=UPI000869023D|nr:2-oxoglutarate and iron-dependent oxygenase domain-containing protein [Phenylobacterium sp. SCN 70-31]ODT88618.1 MAG: oxidoreductase [Phenylobacterium sp. SCN 70-31]
MSSAAIPLIDFAPARSGDAAGLAAVARQIHEACTATGFFYITNHGVPQAVIDRAVGAMRDFFDLPAEQKRRVAVNSIHRGWHEIGGALMYQAKKPDFKEFFGIGLELPADDPDVLAGQALRGPNNWPAFMPQVQEAFYAYYEAIGVCGQDLLRAVAVSLDIDPDFFADRYRKRMQRTQAVFYPPQPPQMGDDQFGVAPHTDYGCITLLWQDDVGGLEVRNLDGQWIDAPPIDGSFVINVGDLLARWSNNRFASTPHRVVNRSGKKRMSIATFYDPDYSAVVDPLDLGLKGASARYEPVAAGDYILGRIDDSFKYRSQNTIGA